MTPPPSHPKPSPESGTQALPAEIVALIAEFQQACIEPVIDVEWYIQKRSQARAAVMAAFQKYYDAGFLDGFKWATGERHASEARALLDELIAGEDHLAFPWIHDLINRAKALPSPEIKRESETC